MEKYRVSVIMPTYKRADMLPRAINSVLNGTYQNVEVVVVDDNDPQSEWRLNTESIMQQYKDDNRVLYIKHEKNRNGSVARNTGIKNSTGDIITYLDDDDWYYPEKIRKQVEYLLSHPEHRAVYCGWKKNKNVIPLAIGDNSFGTLSGTDLIITNSIMMWKKDSINCGGWDESLQRHQEAALLLNYFRYGGTIGKISEILVEFDTSDRSNSIDPIKHEEIILYLFNKYDDLIKRCEYNKKNSKGIIYCYRYKAIFYHNIVCKKYISALRIYLKIILKYPILYNKILFLDIYERIFK